MTNLEQLKQKRKQLWDSITDTKRINWDIVKRVQVFTKVIRKHEKSNKAADN